MARAKNKVERNKQVFTLCKCHYVIDVEEEYHFVLICSASCDLRKHYIGSSYLEAIHNNLNT